jgi:hypothetical protein
MTPVDPYSMTNKLDDALIKVVVTRLEARGKHPMFARMLQDYLDAMQIDTAKTVLDMGCGTGVAARAIAPSTFRGDGHGHRSEPESGHHGTGSRGARRIG